jgi:hypothetical protein
VYLYDPEIVDVGLGGDPLHIVRLDVLNKDHILNAGPAPRAMNPPRACGPSDHGTVRL